MAAELAARLRRQWWEPLRRPSRDAAELVPCCVCWVQPGEPCDRRVVMLWWEAQAGYHFPRLCRAQRKLGQGRAQRLAELSGLRLFELLAMVQAGSCGAQFHRLWPDDRFWARQSRDRLLSELLP